MAFSLSQLDNSKQKGGKYFNTQDLFAWCQSLDNISDKTKLAIYLYLRTRLSVFGRTGLSLEYFKYMIKDLLKNCCYKEFIDIVPEDTELNIDEIVFQLKWALRRHRNDKRTLYKHSLYMSKNKEIDLRKYVKNNVPKRKQFSRGMTADELDRYFGEERWK